MLEALKCPACAASLEAPKDGSPLLRCPYCNTMISQEELDRRVRRCDGWWKGSSFGPAARRLKPEASWRWWGLSPASSSFRSSST